MNPVDVVNQTVSASNLATSNLAQVGKEGYFVFDGAMRNGNYFLMAAREHPKSLMYKTNKADMPDNPVIPETQLIDQYLQAYNPTQLQVYNPAGMDIASYGINVKYIDFSVEHRHQPLQSVNNTNAIHFSDAHTPKIYVCTLRKEAWPSQPVTLYGIATIREYAAEGTPIRDRHAMVHINTSGVVKLYNFRLDSAAVFRLSFSGMYI